jgi:DnaK suppressor protein
VLQLMTKKTSPAVRQAAPSVRPAETVVSGSLTEAQLRAMPPEDYMNDAQLAFFRELLLQMRKEVVEREIGAKERLNQGESHADPADRATAEEEYFLDMRLRERESRLLRKIDDALRRIRQKEFGYCEVTGEPIGIPRLLIRPTATVCVEVKDRDERLAMSRAE